MRMAALPALPADPRWFQIAGQATILSALIAFRDYGSTLGHVLAAMATCLAVEYAGARATGARFDWKSPFITSLSLALLLRANEAAPLMLAAALGIGAKFLVRFETRHVFNPANLGIVLALILAEPLLGQAAWTSTGEWGSALWFAALIIALGAVSTTRAGRLDVPLVYLGVFGALIFARALILGDPLAIPSLRITNAALVLFAFFTISDPRTTPDDVRARVALVSAAATLAYVIQYHFHVSDGVFYAPMIIGAARWLAFLARRARRSAAPAGAAAAPAH